MSKLSKANKYAIQWLDSKGFDKETISKELKVTLAQIDSVLVKNDKELPKTSSSNSKNLMITHTSGKKINSVAIMTKEASELGDETRNKIPTKTREVKGIFRPKK